MSGWQRVFHVLFKSFCKLNKHVSKISTFTNKQQHESEVVTIKPHRECGRTHIKSFQPLCLHTIRLVNFLSIVMVVVVIFIFISPVQRQVLGPSVYTLIFARVVAWVAMCRRLKGKEEIAVFKFIARNSFCFIFYFNCFLKKVLFKRVDNSRAVAILI